MSDLAGLDSLVVRAATPVDAEALIALFVREGSPCFCRYWHFAGTNKEWEARCAFDAETSARELREAVVERRDEGMGIVAIAGEQIVGWLKLAPRATLTKLLARSPYKGLDVVPETLGIGCFLVDPRVRRHGVAA
ncbi:MAG: N-acetyltransferase, partial [Polyangiales bacterium]